MEVAVCFSGGKDSTLAALLLEDFYDVTLVCATAGVTDAAEHAREAAAEIGFPFETATIEERHVREAAAEMVADGFPRNGIQTVHESALEVVAGMGYDAVADGTRRDDRVPTVGRAHAQSLEDRHGIDYRSPLAGLGRNAVDRLVEETLTVETGPSETIPKGDYEAELRALIAERNGEDAVESVCPVHEQSYVRGLRDDA
jgi:predicted subunit of tRNA(5-methylaminomethyl-2-thiouridylate) methyltransferase